MEIVKSTKDFIEKIKVNKEVVEYKTKDGEVFSKESEAINHEKFLELKHLCVEEPILDFYISAYYLTSVDDLAALLYELGNKSSYDQISKNESLPNFPGWYEVYSYEYGFDCLNLLTIKDGLQDVLNLLNKELSSNAS